MSARDLESIYADFSRMVYWTAYGVSKNENDAMDVMQNVFMRAMKHMGRLGAMDDAQVKSWLYRVAMNLCIDSKRHSKHETPADELPETPDEHEYDLPESVMLSGERNRLVREAIDSLPEIYRETVVLHYFSELGYDEIARLTGVSEGTVKSRMSRAKTRLAVLLKEGEA